VLQLLLVAAAAVTLELVKTAVLVVVARLATTQ
jgi:hypothetical protein